MANERLEAGGVRAIEFWPQPSVSLTIPGRPVAHALKKRFMRGRPGKPGFTNLYLLPEAEQYRDAVMIIARSVCKTPILGPVSLTIRAFAVLDRGRMPDLTNIVKLVEDGLKGIAFGDDRWTWDQDNKIRSVLRPSEERVEVTVRSINASAPE